jgi:hypothetical protein
MTMPGGVNYDIRPYEKSARLLVYSPAKEVLAKRSKNAVEELKNICSIVPIMDKMAAIDLEFSIGAMLFARDECKAHMNDVLFLEKLRKKKQK